MARAAEERPAQYQKSLLTYFDILGFREMVGSGADPEQVASRLRVFSRLSQPERGEMEKWQHTFSHFSDLAVRNVPIKAREELGVEQGLLYWELLDLAYIQSHLAEDGILIRGATTVGDIYVDDRLIFGPALIRAYELERGVASYPRIILDSRVLDRLADSPELCIPGVADQIKSLCTVLARDNDGTWFVDYLQATMHELASQPTAYRKFLRRHRDVVRKAAAKFPELSSPAAKIGWLISYHNRTVGALTVDAVRRYEIERQDLLV
jgi:hypothetical protein